MLFGDPLPCSFATAQAHAVTQCMLWSSDDAALMLSRASADVRLTEIVEARAGPAVGQWAVAPLALIPLKLPSFASEKFA